MSKRDQRRQVGCDRLAAERRWPLQRRSPQMTPAQTQPPKASAGVILLKGNDVRGAASPSLNFSKVSNIDQRSGTRKRMLACITARESASTGDRETEGSRPTQGGTVTSSQRFLTAIERPRCSRCQARMMLERVWAGPIGFERRLFECPRCDHVETTVIASDSFKSNATGWLAGELRAPN